jgi:hypothetical protein
MEEEGGNVPKSTPLTSPHELTNVPKFPCPSPEKKRELRVLRLEQLCCGGVL